MKTILLSLLFVIFSGCNGQTQKKNVLPEKNNEKVGKEDISNEPKIAVKVNKEYDDQGRVVKYDSTYSCFYSSSKGPLHLVNDSVYNRFLSFLEKSNSNLMNRQNNNIFFNDSPFKYDFFNDNYFQRTFELNEKTFESMYLQMDSINRDHLQQNYPKGYPKRRLSNN